MNIISNEQAEQYRDAAHHWQMEWRKAEATASFLRAKIIEQEDHIEQQNRVILFAAFLALCLAAAVVVLAHWPKS